MESLLEVLVGALEAVACLVSCLELGADQGYAVLHLLALCLQS